MFNPIAVQTIPYSTLGTGFSILQGVEPIFTFTVLNATDTATTSGFDELFADGVALSAELRSRPASSAFPAIKISEPPGTVAITSRWDRIRGSSNPTSPSHSNRGREVSGGILPNTWLSIGVTQLVDGASLAEPDTQTAIPIRSSGL